MRGSQLPCTPPQLFRLWGNPFGETCMKVYEVREFGIENLALAELDEPHPSANEVVVKIHAASLNYRDLMFINGRYNPKARLPAVPFSDGSGEVVAVGTNAK